MRRIGYPIFEIALVALLFVAAAIGLGSVFFFRFSSDNEDTQDNIIRMSDSELPRRENQQSPSGSTAEDGP